jgi:hypothetical protein
MFATTNLSRIEENIFRFIADAGEVTPGDVSSHLGVVFFPADAWLRKEADRGYLYAAEDGRYRTSCPIAA